MAQRCVVLDDYQNVAMTMADWSSVTKDVDVEVLHAHLGSQDNVVKTLQGASIVCLMRERTALPAAALKALPDLKLLITTGMYNASVDIAAALAQGITFCGTRGFGSPTAELAMGLIIDLARNISAEDKIMKDGGHWQTTVGTDLQGATLGLLGLGKLGARMAKLAQAFDMKVIAWSQNLTAERAREVGVEYVSKEELFARADFLSIHYVLSDRTRGLVTAADLGRMKPTAVLVNTSRGPIVEEAALIDALQKRTIRGAGIDVYDTEPLPAGHPLRKLPNVVLTPHLGYVTQGTYRQFYTDIVEDIRAWLDGKPVRLVTANK